MTNTEAVYTGFKSSVSPILDYFLAVVQKRSIISSGNHFCNMYTEYTVTETSRHISLASCPHLDGDSYFLG